MNLPHTVTIERASAGALDDRGVAAQTWATLATARAFVQPKSAREMEQLSQGGPVLSTHNVYLAAGTTVLASDRVSFLGLTYQLDGIVDPAGLGHHLKADAHVVSGAA